MTLKVDPERKRKFAGCFTGIYVRAMDGDSPSDVDITVLDKESLREWLRSRGGKNEFAEEVVLILLEHSHA